jgi:fatty-acyl-CoA synthase
VPAPGLEALDPESRTRLKARQGFPHVASGGVAVVDETMQPVPADGEKMGEVVLRGNTVMNGYFGSEEATAEAFAGG